MNRILLILALLTGLGTIQAAGDYKTSAEYLALRDSMRRAFNDGDSTRFFPALERLQDYLLEQNDLHAYYTQRCNEIVFLMNEKHIFEAYKLARNCAARYYPEWYSRYNIYLCNPLIYFDFTEPNAGIFSWDTSIGGGLTDPDGIRNLTPAALLARFYK